MLAKKAYAADPAPGKNKKNKAPRNCIYKISFYKFKNIKTSAA